MSTEKWIAGSGQGLTWGDAFTGSTLNSLASGNALLSDISITNGTALDIFADVQIYLASAAFVAPNFIGVYLYPLVTSTPSPDLSYYGDGRFGAAASGPPPGNYAVGSIGIAATTSVQSGILTRIVLPPGTFKFVLYNQGGVNFASSGNLCQYRTYNRSIA
jgi:hypothetical protein